MHMTQYFVNSLHRLSPRDKNTIIICYKNASFYKDCSVIFLKKTKYNIFQSHKTALFSFLTVTQSCCMGLALFLPCNAHDFSILCIWQMFTVSLLCVFPRTLFKSIITRDISFTSLNFSSCHFSFSSWLANKSFPDSFC